MEKKKIRAVSECRTLYWSRLLPGQGPFIQEALVKKMQTLRKTTLNMKTLNGERSESTIDGLQVARSKMAIHE